MEAEMVQRLARVFAGDDLFSDDGLTAHQAASPLTVYVARQQAMGVARRAIAAMWEPTDAMVERALDDFDWGPGDTADANPAEVWRAMISAALTPPPPDPGKPLPTPNPQQHPSRKPDHNHQHEAESSAHKV